MMALDSQRSMSILVITVGAIFVAWAIYIIISLITSYNEEKLKTKQRIEACENISFEKGAKKKSSKEMQMACATAGVAQNDNYGQGANKFYEAIGHFTDTGRSQMRGGYYMGDEACTYSDRNFVIIKSVICTETREELDWED